MDGPTANHLITRIQRRRSALILCRTVAGVLIGALSLAPARPQLLWNFTASVPLGLYRIDDTPAQPGDLVAVAPSGSARSLLLASGALAKGRLLLKPLAARGGDTVCRDTLAVSVSGRLSAQAHARTSDGRMLPAWSGCRVLAPNEIFLLSRHPNSFDSRYFGPVSTGDVVGVAHPLLTFPSSPVEGE